jgi:hypothetical protein
VHPGETKNSAGIVAEHFSTIGCVRHPTSQGLEQAGVVHAMFCTKEWPVRTPDATIDRESVDQGRDVGIDVAIWKTFAGIPEYARELDDGPLSSEFKQRLKTRLSKPLFGIWTAAMIDDERQARTLQRQHGVEYRIALIVNLGKPSLLTSDA